jgi:hypothetical protein
MKITLQHLRSLPVDGRKSGYCSKGTRLFCERHKLDWDTAKRDGIDEEIVLATGDAQAIAVVAWAHQVEDQQHG